MNTPAGICTISENGVGVDNFVPELSAIPGVARRAGFWEQEVINANTLERSCDQYTSMVLEKTLADDPEAKEFPLHLASSEFRASAFFPGLAPTLQLKVPEFGVLVRPGQGSGASASAQQPLGAQPSIAAAAATPDSIAPAIPWPKRRLVPARKSPGTSVVTPGRRGPVGLLQAPGARSGPRCSVSSSSVWPDADQGAAGGASAQASWACALRVGRNRRGARR